MTVQTTSQSATTLTDEDKAAVAGLPQRVIAAWAEHDADAFASVFTADGTLILPGFFEKGRDAIRSFLTAAFEGPYRGTRVVGTPVDMRLLGEGVCVLITQGGILAPGESEVSPERAVNATWIAVKHEGTWSLAAYQNSPRNAA